MIRTKSLVMLAAFAVTVPALAQDYTFTSNMDGRQEVPPNNSPAIGFARGTYDTTTNIFRITEMTATDLQSALRASHIHRGAFGVNGPVAYDFAMFGSWAQDGNVWRYTQTSNIVFSEADEQLLLAGNTYINIHTNNIPSGEVRGQINAVPEPATMAALGLGLAALAARRRKKA